MSNIKFNLIGNKEILNQFVWTQKQNIELIHCTVPIYSIKEQLELIIKVPKETDLLWIPNYNIPYFYTGKLIVTVHDLAHIVLPEYRKNIFKYSYSKIMFNKVVKTANAVICVSQFTADELKDNFSKKYGGTS